MINTASGIVILSVDRSVHRCTGRSGGQILLIQHLVSSLSVLTLQCTHAPDGHLLRVTIPDAVLIRFDLLRMSKILLETCTCRGL